MPTSRTNENVEVLRTVGGSIRSIDEKENGDLEMVGLGVVFGGVCAYGTTFHPPKSVLNPDGPEDVGTNYRLAEMTDGVDPDTKLIRNAMAVPLFYEHGEGVLGALRLGHATPHRITDEGIEYLITVEIERAGKYMEFIKELKNEGLMGLSTQTMMSFYDVDWRTGNVRSWSIASGELSMTISPAEPRTIDALRSIYTRHGVELMPKPAKDDQVPATTPVNDDPQAAPESGEPVTRSASDAVNDAFDQVNTDLDSDAQDTTILAIVTRSFQMLESLSTRIEALEETANSLSEQVGTLDTAVAEQNDQYIDAVGTFATRVAEITSDLVARRAVELAGEPTAVRQAQFDLLGDYRQGNGTPQGDPQPTRANGDSATAMGRSASGYSMPNAAPGQRE